MSWRFSPEIDWTAQAACRNTGLTPRMQQALADRFFADHRPTTDVIRCCKSCPVREMCLKWALDHDEEGYWAGTSYAQRQTMKEAQ